MPAAELSVLYEAKPVSTALVERGLRMIADGSVGSEEKSFSLTGV
jgi:hypothetical protein